MPRRRLPLWLLATVLACGEGVQRTDGLDGPLVRELRSLAPLSLRWNVRLAIETAPPTCEQLDSLAINVLWCDAPPIRAPERSRLATIAGRASDALENGVDIDALHAATLVDLIAGDTSGNILDRSISHLEMITRLSPNRSHPWTDLSGALLMRAAARREGRALVAALDAASRALELDSTSTAASYNRALTLDLMAMDHEAAREWRRFLSLSPRSSWSALARRRLTAVGSVIHRARPPLDSPPDSLRAFVTANSFEARLFAWEDLLGGWAQAMLSGDTVTVRDRLSSGTVIATDIVTRYADSSLSSAIASIRWAITAGRARELAQAHAAFARGRALTLENKHREAEREFIAVLANAATPPVLRDWAAQSHANALLYLLRTRDAIRTTTALLGRMNQRAHPSLAGRAWWNLSVMAFREGRDLDGIQAVTQARRHFEFAGEADNIAATGMLLGERALRLGIDEGFTEQVEAMRLLRPFPLGLWRHNALYILATNATRLGLDRAAMAFVDEGAATASRVRAASIAELRLIRARSLWESGDTVRARQALLHASHTIDSLPSDDQRATFRTELAFTLASGPLLSSGDTAITMLDAVIARHDSARRVTALVPALIARARVALLAGSVNAAESDLRRATELYEQNRDGITSLPERAALVERARGVFDQLAMVRLARGDAAGSLEAVERGRLSFTPIGRTTPTRTQLSTRGLTLNFALVTDTLVTWVVDGDVVTVHRTPVVRDSLVDTMERVRVAMELQSAEVSLQPVLARLYDWFIRPVESRLGTDSTTLTIVSDASLADIPFSALYDSSRKTYLVQRRPVRWAATMTDAHRASAAAAPGATALVVSSPGLDFRVFPALGPLPGAERETQSVASFFAAPVLLRGREADSAAMIKALGSAEHLHFAGHAVFDDARPDRSRLALMPRGIDAATISTLDLRRLRLAVLSACETMRAPGRGGAGFTGLAESFLVAGAGGVIGSLWRVNDDLTDAFMREFYGAYRANGDAAAALRHAKLRIMQAPDSARHPSAWAAFRLAGR